MLKSGEASNRQGYLVRLSTALPYFKKVIPSIRLMNTSTKSDEFNNREISGQSRTKRSTTSFRRIFPNLAQMTLGGGPIKAMRSKKSASFVTRIRPKRLASSQICSSVRRLPNSVAWTASNPKDRPNSTGRFSSTSSFKLQREKVIWRHPPFEQIQDRQGHPLW